MQIKQLSLQNPDLKKEDLSEIILLKPDLLFLFTSVEFIQNKKFLPDLKQFLPTTKIVGCTTAGEIMDDSVYDNSAVMSAVKFKKSDFFISSTKIESMEESFDAGKRLGQDLMRHIIDSVIILAQGVKINGSALIDGIKSILGNEILITGGLAGDNGKFTKTFTILDDEASENKILAIAFGSSMKASFGTYGGWKPFGPLRKVTRSLHNVLYELDSEPALDIYKKYLGEYANDLPASGLLFPLEMPDKDRKRPGIIRTIIGIDENEGALILAGDIIQNGFVRLMESSTDSLVNGAVKAAEEVNKMRKINSNGLALLVSCIGRKLIMGVRVDEEVEAVKDHLGKNNFLTGFYSNGEIGPLHFISDCKLHNQTMSITFLAEEDDE